MRFSRQEYWSGLPFPSPGDLLNPGIEPISPALAGGFFTLSHLVVWMRKTINSMHNKEVNYTVCYKVVSAMENIEKIEQNKGMAGRIGIGCSFK